MFLIIKTQYNLVWSLIILIFIFYILYIYYIIYILIFTYHNKYVVSIIFFINIKVKLIDNGTLFHPHFDILFSQNIFKNIKVDTLLSFNVLSMYIRSLL